MTGNTNEINIFNNWFSDNYGILQKYCNRYKIDQDLLNDVYINVRDRIARSGYTQTYFKTYVVRSLRNLQINEKKKLNGRYEIEFENEDYTNTIENKLQEKDYEERDTQQYREDVMYLSKKLFEYLMQEGRYSEEYNFVFRSYYLMPGRMTYSKLHQMTGIDKVKCCRIIKTIKRDIRLNFLQWLNNGQRRNN